MRHIVVIAHNLRSCHNVGSLLRTAEGLGVENVIFSGYTPYPYDQRPDHSEQRDNRLPHEAIKLHKRIQKTALGAETSQAWEHAADLATTLASLRADGFQIVAVEQAAGSMKLPDFTPLDNIALLVGREVEGVEPEVLALMDAIVEIPMFGSKESFNVVQAAAMAIYRCRFHI